MWTIDAISTRSRHTQQPLSITSLCHGTRRKGNTFIYSKRFELFIQSIRASLSMLRQVGWMDGCKVYSLICEVKSIVIHLTWRIIYLFFFIVHLLLRTFIHSFYTRRVKRKAFLISLTLFFIDYKTL